MSEAEDDARYYNDECGRLNAEIGELVEKLSKSMEYASHGPLCPQNPDCIGDPIFPEKIRPCDCGLDELEKSLEKYLK